MPKKTLLTATILARMGDVDRARAIVAAAPPGVVVIEVPVNVPTRGRR